MERLPEELKRITQKILDASFRVHAILGPGLLESVYQRCLSHELQFREIPFRSQLSLPILYDGIKMDGGLRIDFVVDNKVLIEVKAAEKIQPVFTAQVLTYLKLSGLRLGLLINFNVAHLRNGIRRIVL